MAKSIFLFISGTAGAGKDTIISHLQQADENIVYLQSHTSRPRRVDDKPNTYHYVETNQRFEELIDKGEVLEFDKFNNNYYGISKKEINRLADLDKVVVKDLSVLGVSNLKELKVKLTSVFLTAEISVLKQRLLNRKYDKKQIRSRLRLYKKEQQQMPKYDYIIHNNSIELTTNRMLAIANTERNKLGIETLESCQNVLVKKLDKLVNRLQKGKAIGFVKVTEKNNRIYIVDGINEYLAYLKTGKHCPKLFVDNTTLTEDAQNLKEWKKLIKLYKN